MKTINFQLDQSRFCPICKSKKFKKLRNCSDRNNPFWRKCQKCKAIYAREIPTAEVLKSYYSAYYVETNLKIPEFVKSILLKKN